MDHTEFIPPPPPYTTLIHTILFLLPPPPEYVLHIVCYIYICTYEYVYMENHTLFFLLFVYDLWLKERYSKFGKSWENLGKLVSEEKSWDKYCKGIV